eukprot:m.14908 g.14908  ORF g.14908 m.14908 type:complete len:120 (-) comp5249_c0_seq1:126-485(-)
MGCCCGKPVPPDDEKLIGTWANSEKALSLRTGYGAYRVKKGYFGFIKSGGERLTRITIKDNGWISYVAVSEKNFCKLIDMPCTDWEGETMKMACSASLKYELSSDGESLTVDGVTLTKH